MSAGMAIGAILVLCVLGAVVYLVLQQQEKASKAAKAKASSRAHSAGNVRRSKAMKRADGPVSKAVKKTSVKPRLEDFRATTIVAGDNACEAVAKLTGKRFLAASEQIPMLPLLDCDVANCTCRYVKYRDRREPDGDRRALGSQHRDLLRQKNADERRDTKRGRRESDDFDF